MIVGIFGAWRALPGDTIYTQAEIVGRRLAESGHAVLTGGYSGVMEAANRGAALHGGRSIGVTCSEIDRLLPANKWANEQIRERDLPSRLATCFRMINAAVFLPGRAGTITELALALEMREKGLLAFPVFLTCHYWDAFIAAYQTTNCSLPYPRSLSPNPLFLRCLDVEELISNLGTSQ